MATRLLVSLSAALHAALLEEPNAERVRSEPVHELAWKNGCLISFPHGCSRAAWFEDLQDDEPAAYQKFYVGVVEARCLERARDWYKKAESGIPMLSEDCQLPIQASLDMYSSILKKIEDNDYDNFNLRAYTPKWQKLMMIPYSTLKVKMNEGKS